MALTEQQLAFLNNYQKHWDDLAKALSLLDDEALVYASRVYSAILDADLIEREITQVQLGNSINLHTALSTLLDGGIPDTGSWRDILNVIRRL